MPKLVLEFNLPEESYEFNMANNAHKMSVALEEIYNLIRARLKYNDTTDLTKEDYAMLEEIKMLTSVREVE